MIVCSCNILSDHDVRSAVRASEDLPRNAKQVYGCLGCSAECGRCARTIKTIIDQALDLCALDDSADDKTRFDLSISGARKKHV
jgi:bacterioferritin-associated ferredoxin